MIMDYIPSSLNLLIKEQRKIKKPFAPIIRKLIIFQLFKALYYMQVRYFILSSLIFATGISNLPIYSSMTKVFNSKFAILVLPKFWRNSKVMFLIFVQGIIGRLSLLCRQLITEHKLMYGQLDVSACSFSL